MYVDFRHVMPLRQDHGYSKTLRVAKKCIYANSGVYNLIVVIINLI